MAFFNSRLNLWLCELFMVFDFFYFLFWVMFVSHTFLSTCVIFLYDFSSVDAVIWIFATFCSLLFLVPAPFIHLRLRQACDLSHFANLLFSPIHFSIQLLFQHSNLSCALSFAFLSPALITVIIGIRLVVWILLVRAFLDHQIFKVIAFLFDVVDCGE